MSKRTAIDKVRDYAVYLHKPFSYKNIMRDLCISKRTALLAIAKLKEGCEIVAIGKPGEGIYRHATAAQKAAALKAKREAAAADMRVHGDEYHEMLSEVG